MPAPVAATEENRSRPAAPTKSAEIAQIGPLGKPVGAVVAAAKVLRVLHASERPLNASEVARAAGLHRGTAYNILRTLQAESFVGYDEATRTYTVSLRILELAYGVLRRSGLLDIARPLMHAVSDAHGVSVYLSKVVGPSSLLLLDWVGAAFQPDLYVTVGRPSPVPAGASGIIMAAFGNSSQAELQALFSQVAWYQKPSFSEFLARVTEAKQAGFAVDRGDHVSGDHTDFGAGSVAGMGAVTDPDRCGALARSGGRSAGAAVPRDAIGGCAPIRERPIAAPRMTRVTSSQGGQHGCLTDDRP